MSEENGVFGFSKAPTAVRDEATGFVIFGVATRHLPIVPLTMLTDTSSGITEKIRKLLLFQFLIDNCVVSSDTFWIQESLVVLSGLTKVDISTTLPSATLHSYNLTEAGDTYYFYQTGLAIALRTSVMVGVLGNRPRRS